MCVCGGGGERETSSIDNLFRTRPSVTLKSSEPRVTAGHSALRR